MPKNAMKKRIEDIRGRGDLDAQAKGIMARNVEETERRKLEVLAANIELAKQSKIQASRESMESQVQRIQGTIRTIAVAAPPIPVFALGVLIFIRRRAPRTRRSRSGQALEGRGVTDSRKTAVTIGVALVMTLLAWVTVPRSSTPDAFEDRGTTFFPGFNDPTMAQSLEVVDFDAETATAHPFKVQVQNGLWSIPSHYNYPADAEQQLSQISAAIIALKKDVVAAENVSEQERTGTLDPLDETLPAIRGRGTRVIIKGDNDRLLADIIIGKPLEGRPAFRYVRLADQRRIYVAEVGDLDISTNFGDWVDRDLLKIVWDDVDEVIIRDYSLNEAAESINNRDTIFDPENPGRAAAVDLARHPAGSEGQHLQHEPDGDDARSARDHGRAPQAADDCRQP